MRRYLALHGVEDPENYSTYFMKIDGVKFKQKVVSGRYPAIRAEVERTDTPRHRYDGCQGLTWAAILVTEAQLMAQVARNKA